jgi:hypothetical protein
MKEEEFHMETVQRIEPVTKWLLAGGLIAGPVYVVTAFVHGLAREGFDFTRHSVSLLSNGDLGWIQISNFLVTGALVIAGAAGIRRALQSGRGKRWGPVLVAIFGLGLISAGIFIADPVDGFPPGTPQAPGAMSLNGLLHFASGGIGFLALTLACFVFAARFASLSQPGWAAYSAATGLIFFASFLGIASAAGQALSVIGFWIGLILAWLWLSSLSARLISALS